MSTDTGECLNKKVKKEKNLLSPSRSVREGPGPNLVLRIRLWRCVAVAHLFHYYYHHNHRPRRGIKHKTTCDGPSDVVMRVMIPCLYTSTTASKRPSPFLFSTAPVKWCVEGVVAFPLSLSCRPISGLGRRRRRLDLI